MRLTKKLVLHEQVDLSMLTIFCFSLCSLRRSSSSGLSDLFQWTTSWAAWMGPWSWLWGRVKTCWRVPETMANWSTVFSKTAFTKSRCRPPRGRWDWRGLGSILDNKYGSARSKLIHYQYFLQFLVLCVDTKSFKAHGLINILVLSVQIHVTQHTIQAFLVLCM